MRVVVVGAGWSGLYALKWLLASNQHEIVLLEKEGVKVKKDQVVEFKKRFWDPAVELSL